MMKSKTKSHLYIFFGVAVLCLLALPFNSFAAAKRVVVIKIDGLPPAFVDQFVKERDVRTDKSALPWINHIFYEQGTRVANFYVRGMSLSAPSWSILDTGQHLQVKGNVEYDRLMLGTYDYLNLFPFYISYSLSRRVDMPGPELLDEIGTPLLLDAYKYDERFMGFQLFQRGVRWSTLQRGLQNRFTTRTPRELFDEWTLGFELRPVLMEQTERELLGKLKDSRIKYLDYYSTEFDHAAHNNRDHASHLRAAQDVDALVGRIWTAIQATPEAADTALILVSDHGINSDEKVYSQGFNLVELLGSRAGGGHHVITKRRLMLDYSLKGIYPLVPLITSTSKDSFYLKNQSTDYPTALLDFDGNERAAMHLRDGDLNALQILLQQLQTKSLHDAQRRAAIAEFFRIINSRRDDWTTLHRELTEELAAVKRHIAVLQAQVAALPKKHTKADMDAGIDLDARRVNVEMLNLQSDVERYEIYLNTLAALLYLRSDNFDATKIRIEDVIAKNAMGESNSLYDLQNYIVGLNPNGLVYKADGTLDAERSFTRVNYFPLLQNQEVRNKVQPQVSRNPIDFVAVRLSDDLTAQLARRSSDLACDQAVWLYGGESRQALVLGRERKLSNGKNELRLRYVPVKNLREDASGKLSFDEIAWTNDLPLKIYEDAALQIPAQGQPNQTASVVNVENDMITNQRLAWLSVWHTDEDWLRAVHRTIYSNAVIGVYEQFARHTLPSFEVPPEVSKNDARLLERYRTRQRQLVETDLFVHANNHWNFDVRGFNPGGNHGSFYRVSTHSTLMFAGGGNTGIPRGAIIEEPYDSLSFVPTVMALTNRLHDGSSLPVRWTNEAKMLPGRIIYEAIGETTLAAPVITQHQSSPDTKSNTHSNPTQKANAAP